MDYRNRPIIYFAKSKWNAIFHATYIKDKSNFSKPYDISNDYETFKLLIIDQNTIIIDGINTIIKLDQARRIKSFFETKSNKQKCCYIFQINNSTLSFQNSILKIIEEREDIRFIFTATTKSQVLPTIMSRCVERNIAPHLNRDDSLIDIALNYNISLTHDDIRKYRKEIENDNLFFMIPKKTDEEIAKIIVIWQDILLNNEIKKEASNRVKVAKQLRSCDKFLNLYAAKFFSKKVALSEFFTTISQAEEG